MGQSFRATGSVHFDAASNRNLSLVEQLLQEVQRWSCDLFERHYSGLRRAARVFYDPAPAHFWFQSRHAALLSLRVVVRSLRIAIPRAADVLTSRGKIMWLPLLKG
jgi:hypothetical protein